MDITRTALARLMALTALGALLLAGCGNGTSTTKRAHGAHTGEIAYERGARDLLVRVAVSGGFVPVQYVLGNVPRYSLYGDGTTVFVNPKLDSSESDKTYAPLRTGHVSRGDVTALLQRARVDDLLAASSPDYGRPNVSDLGTTTLTINAQHGLHQLSAYALEINESFGVTTGQQHARDRLRSFIKQLPDGDDVRDFAPDAISVYASKVDDSTSPGGSVVDWPLPGGLSGGTASPIGGSSVRCVSVTGDDVPVLTRALARVDRSVDFRAGGQRYAVTLRPALPGEQPCAAPADR